MWSVTRPVQYVVSKILLLWSVKSIMGLVHVCGQWTRSTCSLLPTAKWLQLRENQDLSPIHKFSFPGLNWQVNLADLTPAVGPILLWTAGQLRLINTGALECCPKWFDTDLKVNHFVDLPTFDQQANETADDNHCVGLIVHHIQQHNHWLEHIEKHGSHWKTL